MKTHKFLPVLLLTLCSPLAFGQEALYKTQKLMTNKKAREESISKDPKSIQADEFVKKLTGDEAITEEVYALAADVFANVVQESDSNVDKMKEAMANFSRDPEAFAEHWSPAQKAKLKELSQKLPKPILKN